MLKYKDKLKGFTIVELAVVLVIIGVIVLITVGAYKGIRGTMVHVEWQTAMDDAYSELIDFASSKGYLPDGQDEFNNIFTKQVDDYSFGGTVGYTVNYSGVYDHTPVTGGKICSLTNADVNNDGNVIFTLKEISRNNRKGKLADRKVSLPEFQSALKCLPTNNIAIVQPEIPVSYSGKAFATSVTAVGGKPDGNGNYRWCLQVDSSVKLKCSYGGAESFLTRNMVDFFNGILTSNPKPFVSNDCADDYADWTNAKALDIAFANNDDRIYLGDNIIGMTIFASDTKDNIVHKKVNLVNSGAYVTTTTNCPNN